MADTSYYAKKKEESDKKIQEALASRRARTKAISSSTSTSTTTQKEESDEKIQSALQSRRRRIKSSLNDTFTTLIDSVNEEVNDYNNSVVPMYGSYDQVRERILNITKLQKKVEAYRSYMGDEAADSFLGSLDQLYQGYNSRLGRSQFGSEEEYKTAASGWLNPDAETNETTVAMRKEKYESNAKRIEEIKNALPWNAKTFLPSSVEKWFLSDGADALVDEWEALEAENNQYRRTQGVLDDYYVPVTDEFTQNAAYRNYSNATRNELWDYDVSAMNGSTALSNGGSFDDEGNILDSKGNIVQYANGPAVEDKLGLFLSATEDDIAEAYNLLSASNGNYTNTWANYMQEGDVNGWKHLTEYEISIYYDLLKREGQAAAYEFLSKMTPTLTKRETKATTVWINSQDGWAQFGLNVASIPMNVFGGVASFVDDGINILQGEEINPYSRAHSLQNAASDIRYKTATDINDMTGNAALPWVGTTWGDVYQSVMSAGDSALGVAIGSNAYGVLMGMGAASSEMKDLYEKGASMGQIAAGGLLAGAAEMVFEKYSIDKLVSMGDSKRLKTLIFNMLKQGGIEASEEMATEIANTITNVIVMGSQSDWVDVNTFAKNVVNAGIGGFISGGLSGGVGATANYVNYNNQARAYGQSIIDTDGGVDALKSLAMEVAGASSDSLSKSLNKQVGKVTSETATGKGLGKVKAAIQNRNNARNTGKLFDNVRDANNIANASQNQADVVKSLERKGIDSKAATAIAAAMVAQANGQQLTGKQSRLLNTYKDDVRVQNAEKTIVANENSTVGQRNQKMTQFGQNIAFEAAMKEFVKNEVAEQNFTPDGSYDVAEGTDITKGKAIDKDGNTFDIKGVASISSEGMTLDIGDGKTINAKDVSFSNKDEALIYEAVANLGDKINYETANKLIAQYKGGNGMIFARGIAQAYTYGFHGLHKSEMSNSESFASDLTPAQRNAAYQLGKQYRPVKDAQDVGKKALSKKPGEKGVFYRDKDGNATDIRSWMEERGGLKAVQTTAIEAMEKMSKMMGVRFNVFESWVENGTRYYLDQNGVKRAGNPNGFYDTASGEIYIDLEAGNGYEGVMLFTVAHELTHFMKQWSPAQFTKIAKIVFQHGDMKGNVAELVAQKMARAKKNGHDISYDTAMEELVADGMETILKDGKVVEFMADVKQQDHKAWAKIKEWFKNLADFLKGMVSAYSGHSAQTTEGQRVAEFSQKLLNQIEQIWAEGALEAGENYQAAEVQKNTTEDGGETNYSQRYLAADTNSEILSMVNRVANGDFKANEKVYLGTVTNEVADQIYELTGIRVHGFKVAIEARQIDHILKGHGVNGDADHSMADPDDIARMEYALSSPDDIRKAGKTQAYTYMRDGRNRTADTVLYEKAIGAKSYYVVQAVPDTKAKTLYIVSAFIGKSGYKKEASQLINAKSLDATAKTGSASTSEANVAQNADDVKSKSAEAVDVDVDTKTESVAPSVLMSERTWTASDYVQERDKAAKEIAKAIGVSEKPDFNMDEATRMLSDYKGGHSNYPAAQGIVDDFVKEYKEGHKGTLYSDREGLADGIDSGTMFSGRDFTYKELIAKNPLKGRVIDKNRTVKLTSNGSIDKSWVVSEVLKQCESLQTKAPLPTYYVNIPDIGKNVEITSKPIEHGFIKSEAKNGNSVPPRSMVNARASLDLPHILQNSIEVNRSDRGDNAQVEFSHVLIGVTAMESANGTIEYYAVRSVVEARKNQGAILTEANVIGKLHAMNAKKIGTPHAQAGGNSTALTSSSLFGYSVADLLNDVKGEFDDTFSNDVYKHFGMTRKVTPFSQYLLFSDRDPDAVSNRTLLANALESAATNDIERQKLREYKDQIETLDAHEKRLRELNEQIKELSFAKGPRDNKRLTDLRIEAKKTANRIDILDKKLFGLEATTPLKSVLERERAAVRKRERKKSREALAAQPTKHSDRDELLPSEYNRLTRKKSIKVSDQELAMIGKQRKSKYSSMKEYDIPIIDFFRIGDYRIPNNGFTYYIRNSGAETFSVVMRRKIKPNIRHETREVISDERRIDNEATNSSDAQKRSERGLDRGNLGSSGDRGKLPENAGRGISAEESQRNGSSGQGHADSGTVKHSDRDNAPTFYSQMANMDITDSMKDSVLTEGQPLYQDRDTESVSNRSLLANAFEGIITNPIEKQKIQEYKGKVAMLDAEEKKLRELNAQIKELSFAKGPKDTKKVNDLRFDAQQTANRIATLDKTLLRLEAATPLQNILKREKDMVRKREQQKSKEALAEQKTAFEAKQMETIDKWRDSRKTAVAKARETAEKRDAIDEKSGDQSTKSSNRQPEKNSLATEETVKYSDNRFFADNVFPPYNISHSDSHEVAERWARSEEGRIQKQRLLSHHGEWYVIQVVDDMDYGYQIVHKLPATNYNRRARKYGTIGRYKSSRDAFDQSASHIRGRTSVRRTRSGVDSDQSGHRGENPGLSGVDEQQVRRREIPTEQTSTDRSSSEDRERGDEPSVKIRRLDELGARAKWLREKIKSDRVSREKKSEYRKELRKVQNEMEELMPGYYPSGSDTKMSDRDTESVSNRALLANALESVTKHEVELKRLREYKENVEMLDAEEQKLRNLNAQIKELSFAKEPRDTKKISELRDEATKTKNRINILDKRLLGLEAAAPLQKVLERERKRAYDRAESKGREALAAQKAEYEAKQKETIDKWRDSRKTAVAKARETAEKRDAIDEKSGDQSTKSSNRQSEKNSLATEETVKYSNRKNFFPGNVFPPYNESHSDSHEVAERWARSEEGRTEKQRLLSHHGKWYVIQVVDDMDYGYQIIRGLTAEEYKREEKFYGTITRHQSVSDIARRNVARHRGTNRNDEAGYRTDSGQPEHRGKNISVFGVDTDQDGRRKAESNEIGDNRSSGEDRERRNEPSVKMRRLDELGARAKWLREKIKSDRVSREKKSEYRKELRKVQNEMEELMPGYYPSGSDTKMSDRDTESVSNRTLLANALESATTNDIERQKLREYKKQIETLDAHEKKLRELNEQIKELSFAKGPRDSKKLTDLRIEAKKTANRIDILDKKLFGLEAATPLKSVLERERTAVRKRERKKSREALAAQREELEAKQRDTIAKWRENRAIAESNARERHGKTVMRQNIRKTIRELDKILNRGNKKKNVKEDMKGFVSKALELADYLFTDHISNDELIRKGITVRMTPREAALVKETEDILSQLYDNADNLTDEEFTRLDAKRKANEDKLRDLLTAQRNERLNTPVYNLFNDLVTEYANLKNSNQEAVKAAYDPNVERFLRSYIGESDGETDSDRKTLLQNMRVVDMTTDELWKLHNAYKMVLHSVRDANKLWVKGKTETIEQMAGRIMRDFSKRKTPDGKVATVIRNLSNKIGWDYEKLYYALDRIGSEAFTELVMNIANSENIVMQDVIEAAEFRDEIVKKHGFNNWDVNKEIDREFLDNTGKKFKMTLGQLMALYAYSRREGAWDHIEYGGFVFGEAALTNPRPADSYKLSKAQCEAITSLLTKEQKAYVEDMQKFLSETMGEKGNEVSMQLYGIKMFGEKNYFPIHIAGQFKAQAQESQAKAAAGFSSMSNAGFTHAQNPNAKAPFVLEGFNEIWADHVNEMSRYHGTVPALEDMRRVMNRSFYSESGMESMAIKQLMENSFGKEAVEYFDNLYREANSGAITDKLQRIPKKLLSLFRKNSVAYKLSVLIQQPTSIIRAYSMIDKKYFGLKGFGTITSGVVKAVVDRWTKAHTNAYNEMLKYAPGVTMAKEIGGFDTHTGGSIRSYLLDTKKSLRQKVKTDKHGKVVGAVKAAYDFVDDNAIANLPTLADKIAWIEIWNAAKRETISKHHDLSPRSEEFMKIVGDRFTEVIRATQVYDSIFAKSPMLKSKSLGVQYLVSFMNEPNTTANMVESALRDAIRGNWKSGVKKAVVIVYGTIVVSLAKSIIYAMHDDDEDETYIEKYFEALIESLVNDFNPLSYIPIARDVSSALQGYDIERPDVAIIVDAIEVLKAMYNNANKDTENMTMEQIAELDKKKDEAAWRVAESVAAFFGIPVKNIRKDVMGIYNTVFKEKVEMETTKLSLTHTPLSKHLMTPSISS